VEPLATCGHRQHAHPSLKREPPLSPHDPLSKGFDEPEFGEEYFGGIPFLLPPYLSGREAIPPTIEEICLTLTPSRPPVSKVQLAPPPRNLQLPLFRLLFYSKSRCGLVLRRKFRGAPPPFLSRPSRDVTAW